MKRIIALIITTAMVFMGCSSTAKNTEDTKKDEATVATSQNTNETELESSTDEKATTTTDLSPKEETHLVLMLATKKMS